MIVLDPRDGGAGTKDSAYDGLTLRHPSAVHTRSSSLLLPDYNTSEALHWKSLPQKYHPKEPRVNPQIWRAAAYAFSVYLLLSLVVILPIAIIKTKKHPPDDRYNKKNNLNNLPWDPDGIENANPPSFLQLSMSGAPVIDFNKTCNIWSHHTESSALTNFSLTPEGSVSLRSNATFTPNKPQPIFGNLLVEINPDPSEKSILFGLGLTYSSYDVFQQTNICFCRSGQNRGLSIYVPTQLAPDDKLVFNISVLLPQDTSSVTSFITYLPLISQTFGELGEYTAFSQIAIEGAGQPISCKSLNAPKISVKNLAASIDGTYVVTDGLILDTVKGPITSNITLNVPLYPVRPTRLQIDTGDSDINAHVLLNSSALSSQKLRNGAGYSMQLYNFNGAVNLDIAYAGNASNNTMELVAQNNLGPTTITLDPHYQGNFAAKSKLDQVSVNTHTSPDSLARTWQLDYDVDKSDIKVGWVGWGARPLQRGKKKQVNTVEISSALNPVTINFGSP